MKILAIRGANLASLAGDFAVDFTAEPLASAGLFAITGPTGSGKSTLLDALCLALYDKTPRLAGVGRGVIPDVGDETLSLADARALLRRGAGEGYAEVDFVGVDGVAYRARWSVRRARNKGQGKMQFSNMALTRVHDGQDVGGSNKTEVLAVIEARVGLKFAQFTRAVLLAQNEFAAFLKSDDSDRAELLEMLTGTERFSRLSMRVYQRSKDETECLARLHDRLAGQMPLADELRAILHKDLAAANLTIDALNTRRAQLEAFQRWHQTLAQAQLAEQDALATVNQTIRLRDDANPRRDALQRIEAVQSARPLLDDVHRLSREREVIAQAEQTARDAHTVAMGSVKRADDVLGQARNGMTQAEQAKQSAAPTLARARELSAQISAIRPAYTAAKGALDDATTAVTHAVAILEEKQSTWTATTDQRQTVVTWLGAHDDALPWAVQWPRWNELFSQATDAATELGRIRTLQPELVRQVDNAVAHHQRTLIQQTTLETEQARREELLNSLAAEAGRHDATAMLARRKSVEEQRDQAAQATAVLRRVNDLGQQHLTLTGKRTAAQAEHDQQSRHLAIAQAARPTAELTLANAGKALHLAQTAVSESVEQLRSSLQPGDPCPVCGATEHPYALTDPGLRAALSALEANVADATTRLDEIKHAVALASATLVTLDKSRNELDRDLVATAEQLRVADMEWTALPLSAQAPLIPGERQSWLVQLADDAKATLVQLATDEQAMHAVMKQREESQVAVDTGRRELTAAQRQTIDAAQALQAARTAADTATTTLETSSARVDRLLLQLDEAVGGTKWHTHWMADPATYHATLQEQVALWLTMETQEKSLTANLATLTAELTHLTVQRDAAIRQHDAVKVQFDGIALELTAKEATLAQIFDGRTADDVETGLAAALTVAQKALDSAADAANQARITLATAAVTHTQIGERGNAIVAALDKVETGVVTWIAEHNAADPSRILERAALEALLAHEMAWITHERTALQALEMAVGTATAVHNDRSTVRRLHENGRPTTDTTEVVAEHLVGVQRDAKAALDQQAVLQAQQLQDEQRRIQAAAVGGEIAIQEVRTRTWVQLYDLIGSVDGRKFRNIAQQMTLDVLLSYANRHLVTLARRYRLERISDTLGLMVIDQDMADEMRSVHSLSGGESFLVSLALALGLASLSSHRVKVESLFIDEGFGSLDADSLRIAMEALDGLQAMGRKVGVISHVQEMTERIGTQIKVERRTEGRSTVSISG